MRKNFSLLSYNGLKKDLFTNGCKKTLKSVHYSGKNNVQKRGTRRGIIRYYCNDCKTSFSSNRRPKNLQEIIFIKYVYKRQILKDLAQEYHRSIPWIRKQILEYQPPEKIHNPREVVIVCDATFYGKRKEKRRQTYD